jgi:hypothetical protein
MPSAPSFGPRSDRPQLHNGGEGGEVLSGPSSGQRPGGGRLLWHVGEPKPWQPKPMTIVSEKLVSGRGWRPSHCSQRPQPSYGTANETSGSALQAGRVQANHHEQFDIDQNAPLTPLVAVRW